MNVLDIGGGFSGKDFPVTLKEVEITENRYYGV